MPGPAKARRRLASACLPGATALAGNRGSAGEPGPDPASPVGPPESGNGSCWNLGRGRNKRVFRGCRFDPRPPTLGSATTACFGGPATPGACRRKRSPREHSRKTCTGLPPGAPGFRPAHAQTADRDFRHLQGGPATGPEAGPGCPHRPTPVSPQPWTGPGPGTGWGGQLPCASFPRPGTAEELFPGPSALVVRDSPTSNQLHLDPGPTRTSDVASGRMRAHQRGPNRQVNRPADGPVIVAGNLLVRPGLRRAASDGGCFSSRLGRALPAAGGRRPSPNAGTVALAPATCVPVPRLASKPRLFARGRGFPLPGWADSERQPCGEGRPAPSPAEHRPGPVPGKWPLASPHLGLRGGTGPTPSTRARPGQLRNRPLGRKRPRQRPWGRRKPVIRPPRQGGRFAPGPHLGTGGVFEPRRNSGWEPGPGAAHPGRPAEPGHPACAQSTLILGGSSRRQRGGPANREGGWPSFVHRRAGCRAASWFGGGPRLHLESPPGGNDRHPGPFSAISSQARAAPRTALERPGLGCPPARFRQPRPPVICLAEKEPGPGRAPAVPLPQPS